VIIATVLAITDAGPGPISLDAALGRERTGPGWALAALLAGVGGAALVLRDWERPPRAEEEPQVQADAPTPTPTAVS
jgi:putative oxidoreductase